VPGWQSAETSIQGFLAAADYDGDGWEDIAVSKWINFESGIYQNVLGAIQTTPIWTTGDTSDDKGVAWADVDGNGWPDLALGHDPTQLWGNDDGRLAVVWTSSATYFGHSDIRFCDVDSDGDEDLAEVHFSDGKVHIYLNDGGVLESTPSWTYDSPTVGTAIAFGKINDDDWPDLVVGNSGEPCVKVFYAENPLSAARGESPQRAAATLRPCYPNPFNPRTTIAFDLSRSGPVRLLVYSAAGRLVRRLIDEPMTQGSHEIRWNGRDDRGRLAPSGTYFCRLEAGGRSQTRTMTLLK
jgi:hypothetical protein